MRDQQAAVVQSAESLAWRSAARASLVTPSLDLRMNSHPQRFRRVRDAQCDCSTALGACPSSSRQGRFDTSPPFQRWVNGANPVVESRQGRQKLLPHRPHTKRLSPLTGLGRSQVWGPPLKRWAMIGCPCRDKEAESPPRRGALVQAAKCVSHSGNAPQVGVLDSGTLLGLLVVEYRVWPAGEAELRGDAVPSGAWDRGEVCRHRERSIQFAHLLAKVATVGSHLTPVAPTTTAITAPTATDPAGGCRP